MTLLERTPGAPTTWHGSLPVPSRYTAGLGGERFLRALRDEGRILGSHCSHCGVTYVPGRAFCERCLDELTDWVDVGLIGEVHTYTVVHHHLDGSSRERPAVVAFVSIADGGIVHFLGDCAPEDVYIGMPVEAVLRPQPERDGSILDIAWFRPRA